MGLNDREDGRDEGKLAALTRSDAPRGHLLFHLEKRNNIYLLCALCDRAACVRACLFTCVCLCARARVYVCVCVCASQMTLVPAFLSNYEIEGLYLIFMRLGTPDDETWPGFRACVCA